MSILDKKCPTYNLASKSDVKDVVNNGLTEASFPVVLDVQEGCLMVGLAEVQEMRSIARSLANSTQMQNSRGHKNWCIDVAGVLSCGIDQIDN